jgi:quercetin dioxygenase-like cupin family protein
MVNPMHVTGADGERLVFPDGAIELVIKISGEVTDGAFSVFEDVVRPGAGPARHFHRDQEETFFVLDGHFDFEIEGVLHHAGAGNIAVVPRGAVHAFKNVGEDHGLLRYMFTPAGEAEKMFRAFHAAALQEPLSVEIMNDIAVNYGQTFVGPPL